MRSNMTFRTGLSVITEVIYRIFNNINYIRAYFSQYLKNNIFHITAGAGGRLGQTRTF